MDKKYKIANFIIVILLLILIVYFLFPKVINSNKALKSPLFENLQNDFCIDTDTNNSIDIQSKIYGVVLSLNKDDSCKYWYDINKFNKSHDFCAISVSFHDFCVDKNILRERICRGNLADSQDINCPLGCNYNKCN